MQYALLLGESDCRDEFWVIRQTCTPNQEVIVPFQWVEHCFVVLLDDLVGGKGS